MSQKIFLLTFKGICMNFLLELNFFILSHPVTSKQPHKVVQIHMGHPVNSIREILAIFQKFLIKSKSLHYLLHNIFSYSFPDPKPRVMRGLCVLLWYRYGYSKLIFMQSTVIMIEADF